MRNEKKMMEIIMWFAQKDERVRGVYMNGSRTNPNAPKDLFQDYDIVYVVTETASFIQDEKWIDIFGERLYMQLPEKMNGLLGKETDFKNCYGYLIQLADGNRIDIHVHTLKYSITDIRKDRLCTILLDKDKALPEIVPSTDEDHWVKKPSEEEYICCCNEFWWILNSVGKGLWRKEIPYVMDMVNFHLRPELIKMLSFRIGADTEFSVSIGKSGKYMSRYMDANMWTRFLYTFPAANMESLWQSVIEMCTLFDESARKVGADLKYSYNEKEAYNSRLFLDCTYELPEEAKEMLMVRKMMPKDEEAVSRIWLEENIRVHSFIPQSYWRKHYDEVREQLKDAEVYVYENQDGIHGFVGIDRGYIRGIFVKEEMRMLGIGKALLQICKSKYFKIILHVYCENRGALEFYMKEGFIISRKQPSKETKNSEYEMIWHRE